MMKARPPLPDVLFARQEQIHHLAELVDRPVAVDRRGRLISPLSFAATRPPNTTVPA
jgi:hypothetical protein